MLKNDLKTGNLNYIRGVYKLVKKNTLNTVFDYVKTQINCNDEVFTEIIRIEKDNGYHENSRFFNYWLYFRDDTNWKRCKRTGIANTNFKSVYEGNISIELKLSTKNKKGKNFENPKHWVVIQIKDDFKKVVVDIFKNFYPRDRERINAILKEHKRVCL